MTLEELIQEIKAGRFDTSYLPIGRYDANIPRISMCGGGCGLGLVDSLKYLYNKAISKITPTPKEKSKEEILEELKKKYPKELFDKYD